LRSFLDFWEANLDGPLFKVTVSHSRLVSPAQVRLLDGEYRLN